MFLIFKMILDTGILPPPLCAILKAIFYKGVKFSWPSGGVSVRVGRGQQGQVETRLASGGLPQSCDRARLLFSLTLGLSPFVGGLCSRPQVDGACPADVVVQAGVCECAVGDAAGTPCGSCAALPVPETHQHWQVFPCPQCPVNALIWFGLT